MTKFDRMLPKDGHITQWNKPIIVTKLGKLNPLPLYITMDKPICLIKHFSFTPNANKFVVHVMCIIMK
jgi:hypothetical protein